jgi:F-type H+-transporting ATPase subunit epsilon
MAEHPKTFHLVIASVGETRFDGAAVSATLPGASGVFTILPHHEPLVTTLNAGTITVREAMGSAKTFPIESGVLEVSDNRAVVLL